MSYIKLSVYTFIIVAICVIFSYFYYRPSDREQYVMPIFNSRTELDNNTKWSSYIETVYLNKPTEGSSNFPLDTNDFFMLYKNNLNTAGITIKPNLISDACIDQNKQNTLSEKMSNWTDTDSGKYWLNKLPPFTCLEDGTYAEIIHAKGDDFNAGTWMYRSIGSGIWFDVGKTICFRSHAEAIYQFLNITCTDAQTCNKHFPDLMSTILADGYKSIQFTENADQQCGLRALEIVHTAGNGFYTCGFDPNGSEFGTSVFNTFKTGWNHTIGCSCNPNENILNCSLSSA